MIAFCLGPYLSFALVFHGAGPAHFSGDCFRSHVDCSIAALAAGDAFDWVHLPYVADCVPQQPTPPRRKG